MNIIKIYLVKYGTRLAYINLEDFSIPILRYLVEHGYKIEVVSQYVEFDVKGWLRNMPKSNEKAHRSYKNSLNKVCKG